MLKDVPEVECKPEPYTECNDIAVDIPFLEPAEECEEVVFEDCVEVTKELNFKINKLFVRRLRRRFQLSCARDQELMKHHLCWSEEKRSEKKERRGGRRLVREVHRRRMTRMTRQKNSKYFNQRLVRNL